MEPIVTIQKIRQTDPLFPQVYALREAVLRVPLGLSLRNEDLSGDAEDDIFIALEGTSVIGCLMSKPAGAHTAKFRQMAVAPGYQGKGIGRQLMTAAEAAAIAKGVTLITLHARANAIPFYTILGYQGKGSEFEEVGIPHLLMEKVAGAG